MSPNQEIAPVIVPPESGKYEWVCPDDAAPTSLYVYVGFVDAFAQA